MSARLVVLLAVLVPFTVWSTGITISEGYFGFLHMAMREPWGAQVLVDLVIALFVAWGGLKRDAEQQGITAWPYMVATLALGSIGVLGYLVHREVKAIGAARTATA